MKRVMLGLIAALALWGANHDGLVAGSKWKKYASCAGPVGCYAPAGCYAPSCYGPVGCSGPVCSGPGCFAPGCFAPACSGPGCYGPSGFAPGGYVAACGGPVCSQPGCFAPYGAGCGGPWFAGCSGCGAPAYGQPMMGGVEPYYAGYAPQVMPAGPAVGGMSMTPAYYAPVAPMSWSVPTIPAAEDLAW